MFESCNRMLQKHLRDYKRNVHVQYWIPSFHIQLYKEEENEKKSYFKHVFYKPQVRVTDEVLASFYK